MGPLIFYTKKAHQMMKSKSTQSRDDPVFESVMLHMIFFKFKIFGDQNKFNLSNESRSMIKLCADQILHISTG